MLLPLLTRLLHLPPGTQKRQADHNQKDCDNECQKVRRCQNCKAEDNAENSI